MCDNMYMNNNNGWVKYEDKETREEHAQYMSILRLSALGLTEEESAEVLSALSKLLKEFDG